MLKCQKQKKIIVSDIKNLFPNKNFKNNLKPHPIDKSGESKVDQSTLLFADGLIQVECYDWSNKYPYSDKLIVSIKTKEFNDFLKNAY